MGLVIYLLTISAEALNKMRIGRGITTGVALVVIVWAFVVALAITNAVIFVALGI